MPRRGENIFKRHDGRWEARFVREIALDGTKKYGSVYARTYREVKIKQQEHINQMLPDSKAFAATVGEVMEAWLCENKTRLKISTAQKYRTIIKKHIDPQLGKLPIKLITAENVAEFTNRLLSQEGLSCETTNQVLTVLRMGFKFARVHYNATLPDIHFVRVDRKNIRVLSMVEQQILVRHLLSIDNIFSFGILLALYTGLRIGEICALKWENFGVNVIHVCGTMQRLKCDSDKTKIVILPPKTASSDRVVPLPSEMLPLVGHYRRSDGFVLERPNGKFTEPRLLQSKFARITTECGLSDVHFHTLRHTFATRCVELGIDVKTLSEILGHCDVKVTLNRYIHPSLELKQSSMDKLSLKI